MGTASIGEKSGEYSWVECKKIDDLTTRRVKVLKIDTEGHEKRVICGAKDMMKRRKIVHIILEIHGNKRELCEILKNNGYTIFSIGCSLIGPYVSKEANLKEELSRSLIGTLKPKVVKNAFKKRGYASLK